MRCSAARRRHRLLGHASYVGGFRQGLSAAGFVEGRNVAVEYRWADNQLDLPPALLALADEVIE